MPVCCVPGVSGNDAYSYVSLVNINVPYILQQSLHNKCPKIEIWSLRSVQYELFPAVSGLRRFGTSKSTKVMHFTTARALCTSQCAHFYPCAKVRGIAAIVSYLTSESVSAME